VESLVSGAFLWTALLIFVGLVAGVSIAAISRWGRHGRRLPPTTARAISRSIVTIAVAVYAGAFVVATIVGLLD
jgi:hypothetical protein